MAFACACMWGVWEGIFMSETQNGFINSIRGWHFPHPHARQENQCFPLQEYCSTHLSLSLLLTACIKLHTNTGSHAIPPWIPGTLRICSNSAQPSNKPMVWKNVSIWTHSPMAVSLLQRCWLQCSFTCDCYIPWYIRYKWSAVGAQKLQGGDVIIQKNVQARERRRNLITFRGRTDLCDTKPSQ